MAIHNFYQKRPRTVFVFSFLHSKHIQRERKIVEREFQMRILQLRVRDIEREKEHERIILAFGIIAWATNSVAWMYNVFSSGSAAVEKKRFSF